MPPPSRQHTERLLKWASSASVMVATLLILGKALAWHQTASLSLMASLLDSSLDLIASLVSFVAIRHAIRPADREHRFGHGKAESLAGLFQSGIIALSALYLGLESIHHMLHPAPIAHTGLGLWVMSGSLLLTIALVLFQCYVIRQTQSPAIRADARHYQSDIWMNIAVLGSLLMAQIGWPGADPWIALIIAFYIGYSAWTLAFESSQHLLDAELPDTDRNRIKAIVRQHPQTIGLHDLRTRRSGRQLFIQLHLELDDQLPLIHAHSIADSIETQLITAYPQAEVLIHIDPASLLENHTLPGHAPHCA